MAKPKNRLIPIALTANALLAACSPGYPRPLLWSHFRAHDETTLVAAVSDSRCPKVGPQNLSEDEKRIVLAALTEVCGIILSPEFENAVKSKDWLATCRNGGRDIISGDEVYRLYTTQIRPFSVRFRKPVNAEASTQIGMERMAIRRNRLRAWRAPPTVGQRRLINTLAHEMTHMIPAGPEGGFRFQDERHEERRPPAVELVSYGIGNLVEKLWLRKAGYPEPEPAKKVESCQAAG